jgi:hypothetical protein
MKIYIKYFQAMDSVECSNEITSPVRRASADVSGDIGSNDQATETDINTGGDGDGGVLAAPHLSQVTISNKDIQSVSFRKIIETSVVQTPTTSTMKTQRKRKVACTRSNHYIESIQESSGSSPGSERT